MSWSLVFVSQKKTEWRSLKIKQNKTTKTWPFQSPGSHLALRGQILQQARWTKKVWVRYVDHVSLKPVVLPHSPEYWQYGHQLPQGVGLVSLCWHFGKKWERSVFTNSSYLNNKALWFILCPLSPPFYQYLPIAKNYSSGGAVGAMSGWGVMLGRGPSCLGKQGPGGSGVACRL